MAVGAFVVSCLVLWEVLGWSLKVGLVFWWGGGGVLVCLDTFCSVFLPI